MSTIRAGMWVESDQGLGIVHTKQGSAVEILDGEGNVTTRVAPDPELWVDIVDAQGQTVFSMPASATGNLRQASLQRLRAMPRVAHLSDAQLASFGYI
jgi:hypothetical protein